MRRLKGAHIDHGGNRKHHHYHAESSSSSSSSPQPAATTVNTRRARGRLRHKGNTTNCVSIAISISVRPRLCLWLCLCCGRWRTMFVLPPATGRLLRSRHRSHFRYRSLARLQLDARRLSTLYSRLSTVDASSRSGRVQVGSSARARVCELNWRRLRPRLARRGLPTHSAAAAAAGDR